MLTKNTPSKLKTMGAGGKKKKESKRKKNLFQKK